MLDVDVNDGVYVNDERRKIRERLWNHFSCDTQRILGGSPCLGACPRSDVRESTLVTSSCHSSLLSECACVPHRSGFSCVSSQTPLGFSLFLSLLLILLSSFGCALVVSCCSAQCSVDVPSSSLSRPPLPFGSSVFACKPTLLPVPACGHSPQEYLLSRRVSSHFLSWLPSFTVSVMLLGVVSCCFTVPRSAWPLRCSSA